MFFASTREVGQESRRHRCVPCDPLLSRARLVRGDPAQAHPTQDTAGPSVASPRKNPVLVQDLPRRGVKSPRAAATGCRAPNAHCVSSAEHVDREGRVHHCVQVTWDPKVVRGQVCFHGKDTPGRNCPRSFLKRPTRECQVVTAATQGTPDQTTWPTVACAHAHTRAPRGIRSRPQIPLWTGCVVTTTSPAGEKTRAKISSHKTFKAGRRCAVLTVLSVN